MLEPMSEARLAEIEADRMPLVASRDLIPTSAQENALRQQWREYRDELIAEVRRLRKTADVLWNTMNRDTKPCAAENLADLGLPQVEDGWLPTRT